MTIQHPEQPNKKAIVNLWFMDNGDIVLGGVGWYEYNDYEKLVGGTGCFEGHKKIQEDKETTPK